MNPNQAVEKFRSEGFVSFERTWTLGHSIAAAVKSDAPADAKSFQHVMYIYPAGDRWTVIDFSHLVTDDQYCESLDEAVDRVIVSLRSKSRPILSER
jgi:hypothetical protein